SRKTAFISILLDSQEVAYPDESPQAVAHAGAPLDDSRRSNFRPPAPRTSALVYIVAIALGLFSGWVNQVVDDPLLTALCVLAFCMFMGTWKKQRPWRWMLL